MIKFKYIKEEILADLVTPVGIYLALRKKYPKTVLLESSDYNSAENASSFIGIQPIAGITVKNGTVCERGFGKEKLRKISSAGQLVEVLKNFAAQFELRQKNEIEKSHAIFGYIGYDAVQYFENITFRKKSTANIPELSFSLYKYIIEIKHFYNKINIVELLKDGEQSEIEEIKSCLKIQVIPEFSFKKIEHEKSNMTDDEFLKIVEKCKMHCKRGDVFQIVPSRRFMQQFSGDDFMLYRTLRSINPSPYQFYFDYGTFRLMGSSPEAQLQIKNGKAYIHPIAGTYKRTGNTKKDEVLAKKLCEDEKERAEHTMLVDLARNDLSRNAINIDVETFSEVQYFSHVIHLVSKVSGELKAGYDDNFKIIADTFPAGTLSGAPKYRAMELIDRYEPTARSFYGGAIGAISFSGEVNLAIMIRSFLSKENRLHYQAGAGIVFKSDEINELNEVNNKLAALRKALLMAEKIV